MTRRFTGRHLAAILVAFFTVVVAINLVMARFASSTFGGVVVDNSYVASQKYNGWLHAARAQERLGWSADTHRAADGHVVVTLAGPGRQARLSATARHPLGRRPDQTLSFRRSGDGSFVSGQRIAPDRWMLRLQVRDGGATWRAEHPI